MSLIFAPWAYGSTRPWAIELLNWQLDLIVGLWLPGILLRRLRPQVHPVCAAGTLLLLGLGWWMWLNARSSYDPDFGLLVPLPSLWKAAPGSVEKGATLAAMWRITGLLGILCFVADLGTRPVWRLRLARTIAGVGVSIALFGIVQKIADRPLFFFENSESGTHYFATWRYHANAGAFLNLTLPFIAGLAWFAFRSPKAHGARALWLAGLAVVLVAAFINVSRAAMVVTALLTAVLGLVLLRNVWPGMRRLPRNTLLLYAALALLGFCAVFAVGWQTGLQRWSELPAQLHSRNYRLLAAQVCWKMLPDAGACGFGPGTFATIFPFYTGYLGDSIRGVWHYAHNDYLQTVIEWGWIGGAAWAALLFGGIFRAFSNGPLLFCAGLALAGVALHALVDFPLQIASLQLYAVVCLGLAWSRNLTRTAASTNHDSR